MVLLHEPSLFSLSLQGNKGRGQQNFVSSEGERIYGSNFNGRGDGDARSQLAGGRGYDDGYHTSIRRFEDGGGGESRM